MVISATFLKVNLRSCIFNTTYSRRHAGRDGRPPGTLRSLVYAFLTSAAIKRRRLHLPLIERVPHLYTLYWTAMVSKGYKSHSKTRRDVVQLLAGYWIGFIMRPLWVLLAGARALSAVKDRRDEGLVSGSSLITGKKVRHIKYDGLDLTGSYRAVKHMDNSGICTFEDHHYSGPIAPYNEEVRYK